MVFFAPTGAKEAIMRKALRSAAYLAVLVFTFGAMVTPAAPVRAQTGKDVKEKTVETVDAIKDYSVEKKNEAVRYARKLSRKADADIKELEAKTAKATGEAKTKSQQQLTELKTKRSAASKKLGELKKASASSWDTAKQGFVDAFKDLRDSLDKAAAEFRKP
jgi:hypothetical protein